MGCEVSVGPWILVSESYPQKDAVVLAVLSLGYREMKVQLVRYLGDYMLGRHTWEREEGGSLPGRVLAWLEVPPFTMTFYAKY